VVEKAKIACDTSRHDARNHFVDVNKMVELGSGSRRSIDDIILTRDARYLIAQNGASRKQEIAFAQTYFAVQTRRAELIEQRLVEAERLSARRKLTATEKELSQVIYGQTGSAEDFGAIRSKGDQALFGRSTQAMKALWKVPISRPLADLAPTIVLKALFVVLAVGGLFAGLLPPVDACKYEVEVHLLSSNRTLARKLDELEQRLTKRLDATALGLLLPVSAVP